GRWTLLRSETDAVDAESFARRLLARWGIVFRDVVARETLAPPWRELLAALRRMEARVEMRGGRCVAGYVGEQFALPEAIDAVGAVRGGGEEAAPVLDVPAHDPLRLTTALVTGIGP